MSKYCLVTDSHLGLNQSSELYHNVVYNLFEEIVNFCKERDIKEVIHLGDFFHERKSLNTKTQHVAHKIARLFDDVKMYLIVGNHDIYYKDTLTPTSLELFKKYSNIEVIEEITKLEEDIVLCPWGLMPEGYDGYCFGHFEFVGFKMNNNYLCEIGQDINQIKNKNNFKHVYSGHFHTPSTKDIVTYLGSPYQQTFIDSGSTRGYYIWEDGNLDFFEFIRSPKFVKINSNDVEIGVIDVPLNITNNIVKLIFTEDKGSIENQKIVDEVISQKPIKFQVDFSQIKIEGVEEKLEESEASLLDHPEIIKEYVNKANFPSHISKNTLLSMINKLREEE